MNDEQQMDHDEDQRSLAEAIAAYAQRRNGGEPQEVWRDLVELGLPGLIVPEALGGLGLDGRSVHAVMESLGRNQLTTPFAVSAVLCTRLLLDLADATQQQAWLPALASGERVLALAHGEPHGDHLPKRIATRARRDGQEWILDGRKSVVPHGGESNAWLVSALVETGGVALFWLDGTESGLRIERYPCIDASIGADLWLKDVRLAESARIDSGGANVPEAIAAAVDAATAGLCAESAGLQSALLDMTLDYVKTRRQFGATLGSFQAIQHRLVVMLVAMEQSKSLSWLAARSIDQGESIERVRAVAAAKVRCTESGRFIGLQSIHLHGGMGMTDELPVGRCVKRLLAIAHAWGDVRHHLGRLTGLQHMSHGARATASRLDSLAMTA